jgi:hypothetical protein
MSTEPTPQQLLTRAAEILDERGWFQGWYIRDDGCVCAVGAVNLAASEADGNEALDLDAESEWDNISTSVRWARENALEALRGAVDGSIVEWNDKPGRTKDEVQAILRRAAERGK